MNPSMGALERMYQLMGGTSLVKPKGRIMSYTWDDLFYRISLDEIKSFGWIVHKSEVSDVIGACFQQKMVLKIYDIKQKAHFTDGMQAKYEAMSSHFDTMYDRISNEKGVDIHVPSLKIGDKEFHTVYFYPPINNSEASAGPQGFSSVVDVKSAADASSCGLDGKDAGLWTELIKAVYDNPIYAALKDVDWTNFANLRRTIEEFVFGRPMDRAPLLLTNGDYLADGEALEAFVMSTLAPAPPLPVMGAAGGSAGPAAPAAPTAPAPEAAPAAAPTAPAAPAAPAAAGRRQRSPSPEITLADDSDSRPTSRQRVDDASLDAMQVAIANSLEDMRARPSSRPPAKFQWPSGSRPGQ
jgi:hypothetical protein